MPVPVVIDNSQTFKAADFSCPDEPKPGADVKTDVALSQWAENVRSAGAECRNKLHAVGNVILNKGK